MIYSFFLHEVLLAHFYVLKECINDDLLLISRREETNRQSPYITVKKFSLYA